MLVKLDPWLSSSRGWLLPLTSRLQSCIKRIRLVGQSPNCSLLLTWSQTTRDISFGQLAEKRQKLTQPALSTTSVQATRLHTSPAMSLLSLLGLSGTKKVRLTPLNTHMENVDLLISEEAQQDMDLKSAFAPTVPQQPFFRQLLRDPKQSPGGVADGQRAHRTLFLKASIGRRPPLPGTCHMRHQVSFTCSSGTVEALALVISKKRLLQWATGHWGVTGSARTRSWPRLRLPVSYSPPTRTSRVDLDLPEGLLVGLGYAATSPDSPLDFRQAQNAAKRSGVASPHRWSFMLPTSARVAQEVYEPLIEIQNPMLCSRMGDTWQITKAGMLAEFF